MHIKLNKGYTLVEMIVSISLFAMIIIIAFQIVGNMGIIKVKQSNKIDVTQDMFYAIENLASTIKDFGGDIDYEEYWNRKIVGVATASGHYSAETGFGNYGNGGVISSNAYGDLYYLCRSNTTPMGTGGCAGTPLYNSANLNHTTLNSKQRYGQYSFQFIDYNSNQTTDSGNPGDENGDGNIQGDDDDENLGLGPVAFSGSEVRELYLIKKGKINERLFFRLNYKFDTASASGKTCNPDGTGGGCVGNLQMLRLTGRDSGFSHNRAGSGSFDGRIDTWECSSNFSCAGTNNLPNGIDNGWVDLLPSYVNVKDFKLFLYPNKDYKYGWKENDTTLTMNPFVRISMTLGYSWDRRKKLNSSDPSATITTSINLTKN